MRIVTVSHGYGTEERMKLLERIADKHDVVLVAPQTVRTQVFGDLAAPTSNHVQVVANRTARLGKGGHFVFRPSWRVYRGLRPDVIHVEYDPWTPEFWSIVLPMLILHPRTPLVLYVKKNTRHVPPGLLGLVERLLTRLGMSRVRRILAVSRKAAGVFDRLGYGSTPVEIQGHLPIDGSVFTPRTDDRTSRPFTAGFVGSIAPHKGIRTLIEAMELLRAESGDEARLILVGPMCDDALDQLIAAKEWVDYRGSMKNRDLPHVLSLLDVFVMPSLILPDHEEHDAHSLLEAMAAGVACVGSRSGIMPELIDEGENGWMFEPDQADELTKLLKKLSDDPSARAAAGAAARVTALEFTGLETLAAQRVSAYQEVARG